MKKKQVTKLTKREKFLLHCVSDTTMARRLFVSLAVLKMWTQWGMPAHKIDGYTYYDIREFAAWLKAKSKKKKGETNNEMLWRRTPLRVLPAVIKCGGTKELAAGNYWVVPYE